LAGSLQETKLVKGRGELVGTYPCWAGLLQGWVTAGHKPQQRHVDAGGVEGCLGFTGSLQVNHTVLGRCVLGIEGCLGWVTVGHQAAGNRQVLGITIGLTRSLHVTCMS
jgi:hypothetical protein